MIKEAMKLVPYDPSIDMQEQGSIASGYDLSQARAKKVYQAMIDMHDVMMEREPTDQWIRLQAGYPEQLAQQEPMAGLLVGQDSDGRYVSIAAEAHADTLPLGEYKLYTTPQPAQPQPVAIEHCIWARNGNTPCPHTSPPQRKPLTDEQVWNDDDLMKLNAVMMLPMDYFMRVVHAVEAAHNIKENT